MGVVLCAINWLAIGAVATGIGAFATDCMLYHSYKANRNAKESIFDSKKGAFFAMVVATYSNIRKNIEQLSLLNEYCTISPKPFGIDCLIYIYDKLFKTKLTITKDRSLPPSKQKKGGCFSKKRKIKDAFKQITQECYPIIVTYLSSVVSIVEMIDKKGIFDSEFKEECIFYLKSQMTLYERLWLFYYSIGGYDTEGMLKKYSFFADIPSEKMVVMK